MKIFVLLLFSAFLLNQASSQTTSFYFPSFSPESCNNGGLLCMGAVTAYDGYLSLSSEPLPGSPNQPVDEVGRVLYHQPVLAWPNITIVSSFTFRISKYPNSTDSGDGMAFIFAPTNDTSSAQSYGSYLGIMDEFTEGEDMHQIAVELDAYKNDFDLDGNHVAIDIKSVRQPVALESLNSTGVDLKSGRNITVRIECNGRQNLLYVNVHYADHPPKNVIKQPINISDIVPSSVYVGFTAATGAFSESHQLLEWSFTSLQSVR
ncbi:hypothetical protein AB3S75_018835 [Citrus x aurantiifolia]